MSLLVRKFSTLSGASRAGFTFQSSLSVFGPGVIRYGARCFSDDKRGIKDDSEIDKLINELTSPAVHEQKQKEMEKLAVEVNSERDDIELDKFYRTFSRKPKMTPIIPGFTSEKHPEYSLEEERGPEEDTAAWFERLQDQAFPAEDPDVLVERCPGGRQGKGARPPTCTLVDLAHLHPTNLPILSKFLMSSGMIMSKKQSGLCSKCQRKVARSIKASRHLGLLPFVADVEIADLDPRAQVYQYRSKATSKTI
ncbi:unnamed protein product [Heterosigma akashiwo]